MQDSQRNIAVIEAFANNLQQWMTEVSYTHEYKITLQYGKKNVKVVKADRLKNSGHDFNGASVYAFIERETLNLLFPASWKAPAKGPSAVRGNLLTSDNLFGTVCQQYSLRYLRGGNA